MGERGFPAWSGTAWIPTEGVNMFDPELFGELVFRGRSVGAVLCTQGRGPLGTPVCMDLQTPAWICRQLGGSGGAGEQSNLTFGK